MTLFVCETFAQIFNAINIRINLLKEEHIDICICDTSRRYDEVCEKMKNSGLFENVYMYQAVLNTNQSIVTKVKKTIENLNLLDRLNKELPNADETYDSIYISGPSISCIGVYYYFLKKNRNLMLNLYEEGLFEYYCFKFRKNFLRRIYSKIVYGCFYLDNCNSLYVYNPELVEKVNKRVKIYKIPHITSESDVFKNAINKIFDYNSIEAEKISKAKYIYLEQSFPTEEENARQKEIIRKISEGCEEDKLLIKMHPASKQNKYSDLNVECIANKYSMELILLNLGENFECTLFSICSSAVFNSYLIFNKRLPMVLLYKLFRSLTVDPGIIRFIVRFKKYYEESKIDIVSDLDTIS